MDIGNPSIIPVLLFPCYCYLIKGRKGYILVDTGMAGKGDKFFKRLKELNILPQQIKLIIITHSHHDHAGNGRYIKDKCKCPVVIHRKEAALLRQGKAVIPPGISLYGKMVASLSYLVRGLLGYKPFSADILIDDNYCIGDYAEGAKIVHTPGHTEGSISLMLADGSVFAGDLAVNDIPGVLGPRHFPPFGYSPKAICKSWERLLELGAVTIYPAHGKPFSAEGLRHTLSKL